jgi:hypothetical protein
MMITQEIEQQRLQIVDEFERIKQAKERENLLIADQIKRNAGKRRLIC